ncbi:uncharacterized protein PV06_06938 [Exophiala oligosperma]|uniref:Uncharacterized protein n=1 Tax=Exophiala oligosperma TaxID=215243 RepID=A0A0D2AN27_9EURO|nr:uncharacterized protein PV06_06938 [Exophiala oligosperma]KIW41376.1 hypothetical protein PV06_06938 [Exophiala oligosperma]
MAGKKRVPSTAYKQHILSWRTGPAQAARLRAQSLKSTTNPQKGGQAKTPGESSESTSPVQPPEPLLVSTNTVAQPSPFSFQGTLAPALSLYIRDVVPSFHRRQLHQHDGVDGKFLQAVVPFVLHHEVVQNSCGAVTLLIQDFTKTSLVPRITREVYQLIEKTYISLRRSISEGRSSLDATIWGIEALIAIWNFVGEYDKTEIHLKAMHDLLIAHGGYEALGFDGFLARTVQSYFNHFNAMRVVQVEMTEAGLRATADAAICDEALRTMPSLPDGLRSVITTQTLTYQCIMVMETVSEWHASWKSQGLSAAARVEQSRHLNVARCLRLLQLSQPSTHRHDILVALALLAYCTYRGADMDSCWIVNCNVQICCKSLMMQSFSACDASLMMWTARMLRAVYGPDNMTCAFSDRLSSTAIAQCVGGDVPGVTDCTRFFWDESLTFHLSSSIQARQKG